MQAAASLGLSGIRIDIDSTYCHQPRRKLARQGRYESMKESAMSKSQRQTPRLLLIVMMENELLLD